MTQIFAAILALISKKQFDRAGSLIDTARNSLDASQMHRLTALSAVLEDSRGNTSAAIDLIRRAIREDPTWLPHWHRLANYLIEVERWLEAVEALDELISLSERNDDVYFLDDARVRKAICLKALGRNAEIEALKREIRPDTEVYLGGRIYTVKDLG